MSERSIKSKVEILDCASVDTLESFLDEDTNLETINLEDIHNKDNTIPFIPLKKLGEKYSEAIKQTNTQLLEPVEFLNQIEQSLRAADRTIQKLKSIQSKCCAGIVDLEHKLEFENLTQKEYLEVAMLIKKLSIYKRHSKDTLEKYHAISNFIKTLDIASATSQLESISEIERFHTERVYTPRIFNIVENKNYPATKVDLTSLDKDIEDLILLTNMQHK